MSFEPHLVHRACADLGGVARLQDLRGVGIGRRGLGRAVETGVIVRFRPGWYGVPETPPEVATAIRHGGALGCISLLRSEGLWVLSEDPQVHVAMRPHARSLPHPMCSCVPHWNEVPRSAGRVPISAALVQVLGCLGAEEFFVALESAMRHRTIDRRTLAALRRNIPADRRWLVDFARWDADSGLESLLRLRLRAHGISLTSQVEVPGVGRVDFVIGDRLILELDGRLNHDGAAMRHKDLVRDAVAAAHGFDTLRFDYALVVHEWPLVEAAILAKFERGAHLSAPSRSPRSRVRAR